MPKFAESGRLPPSFSCGSTTTPTSGSTISTVTMGPSGSSRHDHAMSQADALIAGRPAADLDMSISNPEPISEGEPGRCRRCHGRIDQPELSGRSPSWSLAHRRRTSRSQCRRPFRSLCWRPTQYEGVKVNLTETASQRPARVSSWREGGADACRIAARPVPDTAAGGLLPSLRVCTARLLDGHFE